MLKNILFVGFLCALIISLAGCGGALRKGLGIPIPETEEGKIELGTKIRKMELDYELLSKSRWLVTAFIIVGLIALYAFFKGSSSGLIIAVLCAGGAIWVTMQDTLTRLLLNNDWLVFVFGGLSIAGIVCAFIYFFNERKDKAAFKQVIAGNECFKDDVGKLKVTAENIAAVNAFERSIEIFKEHQQAKQKAATPLKVMKEKLRLKK